MATSSNLTEYERKRLENIRRNDELMDSLKLRSIATQLSASTKRPRYERTHEKPKTDQTPTVIRRSLRTRGLRPSLSSSPRNLGPLSMEEAYTGRGSQNTLIEILNRVGKECEVNESLGVTIGGVRVCKGEIFSDSVKIGEDNEVGGSFDLFLKSNFELLGEKFSGDRLCKSEHLRASVKKEDREVEATNLGGKIGGVRVCKGENLSGLVKEEENEVGCSFDPYSMTLNPQNIAQILPHKITHVRFFPCASSRIIVAGNNLGDVGFWNLDHQGDDEESKDGVYTYHSHSGPVTGILIHQHYLAKVFTSCYYGFIRLMDAEKEVFDLIHSSEYSIFSLSQQSNDTECLYFGEASGLLNIWDGRMGKCSTQRVLHTGRINTIDFNSNNCNILATSSSDGSVCIWDLRSIDANKPKTLKTISHKRSVHSAYFSPSGKCLVTTSLDDTVGIHGGINFEETSVIQHDNRTSCGGARAIWGWDDSYVFICNMKRGVDVISPAQRRTIFTLQSAHISGIPCRFDAHPYNVGLLAGATGGGRVYAWTLSRGI